MTIESEKIQSTVKEVLKSVSAWRTGHFLLSSGLHSDEYVQCQRIMQYPRLGNFLADLLVDRLLDAKIEPDLVVGPALGAVHWELFVAGSLERKKHESKTAETNGASNYFLNCDTVFNALKSPYRERMVQAVFAERNADDTGFEIRRGIELQPGAKVLVVEDVTTTGGSAKKVLDMLKRLECEAVAVGAIADRSGGKVAFDVPFISLIATSLETYKPEDCPLCKAGSVVEKPGSSKK